MSVLYIVDNKYRDLWGLHEVREKLTQKNIKLFFCNKFNWNLAIKYINPSIIILPHIRNGSPHFEKIVNTAYDKKIKVIVFPSESLEYTKLYLENELPERILDKIEKMFLWSDEHGQFVSEKHKKKIVITGTDRFYSGDLSSLGKVKTIGIISCGRYLAPLTGNNNILYWIRTRNKIPTGIGTLKNEVEFISFICNIIDLAKVLNIKVIFKPHPFEKVSLYKEAFPNLLIEDDPDIRVFLKKVDVCINQFSSSCLQAFANKVPVINVNMALPDSELKELYKDYFPSLLGIPINNLKELKKILTNYDIEDLFKMNIERGDLKVFEKRVPKYQTGKLISDELAKMNLKPNKKNFFNFFLYLIKEIYLIIMKSNRDTLFRPFSKKDEKLLKKFSTSLFG